MSNILIAIASLCSSYGPSRGLECQKYYVDCVGLTGSFENDSTNARKLAECIKVKKE